MNLKIHVIALILFLTNYKINAQTVATVPQGPTSTPSGTIMYTPQSWGYAYLTVTGMMVIALILSWLLLGFVYKRRIEEGRMRRTLLIILALGMGFLMGDVFIFLLPKAFGAQIVDYTSGGQELNVFLLLDSYLPSLFILIGFTFFLLVDLAARHFVAKTHMSTTRVPGISHSPAESIRVEESSRPAVIQTVQHVQTIGPAYTGVNTGGIGTTGVGTSGIGTSGVGPIGTISTDPNVIRAERVSTDPRSDAELYTRRRRYGIEGSRKQTGLILLREFIFTGAIGMTVGAVFATYSNYNILAICIGLCMAQVLINVVDAVLLYYSGVSWKKALLWLFLWNAFMWGTVAWGRGMAARGLLGVAYIFAAMCGIFIYLLLVHLMPALVKGKKYDLKAVYLLSFLVGTYSIFAIRAIED